MRTSIRTSAGVVTVDIKTQADGRVIATVQGEERETKTYELVVEDGPDGSTNLRFEDGRRVTSWVGGDHVAVYGWSGQLPLVERSRRGANNDADAGLTAPMPGTVLQVRVEPGQEVAAGDVLVVTEAMKMEHAITAPKDGVVIKVGYAVGDRVGPGDALAEIGPKE